MVDKATDTATGTVTIKSSCTPCLTETVWNKKCTERPTVSCQSETTMVAVVDSQTLVAITQWNHIDISQTLQYSLSPTSKSYEGRCLRPSNLAANSTDWQHCPFTQLHPDHLWLGIVLVWGVWRRRRRRQHYWGESCSRALYNKDDEEADCALPTWW